MAGVQAGSGVLRLIRPLPLRCFLRLPLNSVADGENDNAIRLKLSSAVLPLSVVRTTHLSGFLFLPESYPRATNSLYSSLR